MFGYKEITVGRVLFGGVVGALIAFVCGFFSWEVLPWHDWTFHSFPNQDFVGWVIKENVQKDGVYLISCSGRENSTPVSEQLEGQVGSKKLMPKERPFVYAQIKREGLGDSFKQHILSFLAQLIGASLISFVLTRMRKSSYGGRLLVVTVVGLIAAVLGHIPNWNQFGGGDLFLLVNMADLVATWFLSGLVMAAVVKPRSEEAQDVSQLACS